MSMHISNIKLVKSKHLRFGNFGLGRDLRNWKNSFDYLLKNQNLAIYQSPSAPQFSF